MRFVVALIVTELVGHEMPVQPEAMDCAVRLP
jgi:hypothetical protein